MKIRLFVCLLVMKGTALAAPTTLKMPNGQIYHEAEVTGYDAAFVTIRHASGVASVPIAHMPAEFRKQIKYDPIKAAHQLAAERKAVAARDEFARIELEKQKINKRRVYIRGVITEMRSQGYSTMNAVRYGEVEERYKKVEPAELGPEWKLKQKGEVTRTIKREIRMDGVEVVGVPAHLQPGDSWQGEVWPAGDVPVRNKTGAITSMITRYATTPQLAASLIEEERQAAKKAVQKARGY